MAIKRRKWCPNGCGKKVILLRTDYVNGRKSIYICLVCNNEFSREGLIELNNFRKINK